VVSLGKEIVDPQAATPTYREVKECTAAVGDGAHSSSSSSRRRRRHWCRRCTEDQYTFSVPGVDSAVLGIVVP